jgi:hypothetical protein
MTHIHTLNGNQTCIECGEVVYYEPRPSRIAHGPRYNARHPHQHNRLQDWIVPLIVVGIYIIFLIIGFSR